MFSKDKREPEAPRAPKTNGRNPPSIISASLRIVGNLVSDGDIQVDGTVDGDVQSRSLTVSQGAAVNGGISAETVRIDGAVNGHIKASNVMLGPTARVLGDIIHANLVIEAGAFLEGHCRRMEMEPVPLMAPMASVAVASEDAPAYSTAP
jgi:cytoskeletal protein CcmA (bactofilin family)